jgi:hypothetical protein
MNLNSWAIQIASDAVLISGSVDDVASFVMASNRASIYEQTPLICSFKLNTEPRTCFIEDEQIQDCLKGKLEIEVTEYRTPAPLCF